MRKWLGFLLIGLVGMGCSQPAIMLTDVGRQIELMSEPEQYPLCTPRGDLESAVLTSSRNGYREAMNQLLNTAAGMGATHITIDSSASDSIVTKIVGRSYYCPEDFAQQPINALQNRDDLIILDDPT